jgi:hypothetical protein
MPAPPPFQAESTAGAWGTCCACIYTCIVRTFPLYAATHVIAVIKMEESSMADETHRPTLTDDQNSITAGPRSPVLVDDFALSL